MKLVTIDGVLRWKGPGARLRRKRVAMGLTQAEVAERAGLSRVGYINIETEKNSPRFETLNAIALGLEVPFEEFQVAVIVPRQVRFRSWRRLATRTKVIEEVVMWLEDYAMLEELLGDQIEPPEFEPGGCEDPKAVASRVRAAFGIGECEPAHDIAGLLESEGIRLITTKKESWMFTGLSVGRDGGGPAVVVNTWQRATVERWIFTAAHELGHLILHPGDYDVMERVEELCRDQEANVFAAHFLMPDKAFWQKWKETAGMPLVDRVLKVKRIFRVSYRTVLNRLSEAAAARNINIWALFRNEYMRQPHRVLMKEGEPETLAASPFLAGLPEIHPSHEPDRLSPSDFGEGRLRLLVRRSLEGGLVSRERCAEILGVPLTQMCDLETRWKVDGPLAFLQSNEP